MNNPRTRKTVRAVFFGFLGLLVVVGVIIAVSDSPDEITVSGATVVHHDTEGNQRNIVVEVDTNTNLDTVFNDVIDDLTDDAGYYISINCSTGGTDSVDNRLANGRYAIGGIGQATTGLTDGESEFELVDGATCP
ncbi:hypothetical protein [Saccharomonospora viridis]|uniref:hypothetical protein n=1 Tax=Saccharomonospora viridis TaxID=1852 RepID=UPI0024095C4D|nr:hypothetical protein [Saccharomonospora viridis]